MLLTLWHSWLISPVRCQHFLVLQTSKRVGVNVEGDLEADMILPTFVLS